MKNILLLSLLAVGFTACGTTDSDNKEMITLTAVCNSTDDMSNYQVLQSGDTLSQEETLHQSSSAEPEVEIFHTEDGLKKVCIKSGTAVILR